MQLARCNGHRRRAWLWQERERNNEIIDEILSVLASANQTRVSPVRSGLGSIAAGTGGGEPGSACVVCMQAKATIAFAPCAHVCCCADCGRMSQIQKCPVCRASIQHRIGLYFA